MNYSTEMDLQMSNMISHATYGLIKKCLVLTSLPTNLNPGNNKNTRKRCEIFSKLIKISTTSFCCVDC